MLQENNIGIKMEKILENELKKLFFTALSIRPHFEINLFPIAFSP